MPEINLNDLYYKWICSMIFPDENLRTRYSNVLHLLHNTQFQYTMALDENRMKDGIDLRYHFSCACKIPYEIVSQSFDRNSCSMLEMMASLAVRCENDIMSDNMYGDRTSQWFSLMFCNLGLDKYVNDCWTINSYYEVKNILRKCMFREYDRDGSNGGLFKFDSPYYDLRNMQIWDQMCVCMTQILGY